ncbi:MAG: hypothetical protein IMY81_02350 [Chloroflexi bacterium]|nr:hypothetical protein [Chloroflexota bacterium]
MFHLAAIPIEILAAVMIIEQLWALGDRSKKQRRLSYMLWVRYNLEMGSLLAASFKAVESPSLSMSRIKSASIKELKKLRDDAGTIRYKSIELVEAAAKEYVKTQHIWKAYLDRAVEYDLEKVYQNMMYVLYFIDYIEVFKKNNPDRLFVDEIRDNKGVLVKAEEILGSGIRIFLDMAIELRKKKTDAFYRFISNLEQAA